MSRKFVKYPIFASESNSYEYNGYRIYYKDGQYYIYLNNMGKGRMDFVSDKDAEEYIDSIESCQDVMSSQELSGEYAKYYDIMSIANPDRLDEEAELDPYVVKLFNRYGLEHVGWAQAKPEYYPELENAGLEVVALGKDADGNIGCYEILTNKVFDVIDDVKQAVGEDVVSASSNAKSLTAATSVPQPYSEYYRSASNAELSDLADNMDEVISNFQEILDDYGMTFVELVVANDEYYDAFAENGIDFGVLAKDETGKLGVYLLAGDRVYDIMDEVQYCLDTEW